MDDSQRTEHEKEFEAALAALLIEYSELAAQSESIDSGFWNSMRSDAIRRLKPISAGIQYVAGLKLADRHVVYLSTNMWKPADSNADAMIGSRVDQMIAGIQRRAAEQKSQEDWESVATALIVAVLINEINPESWSIGMSTRSYTMGERTAATAINTAIREQADLEDQADLEEQSDLEEQARLPRIQIEDPEPIDFTVPFPDDDRYAAAPEFDDRGYRRLVAYWMVQTAGGVPDEKVCPICFPLHYRPLHDLPGPFQEGPDAHPRCRCYLEWLLE